LIGLHYNNAPLPQLLEVILRTLSKFCLNNSLD
jgi:hypothetical protein